MKNQISTLLNKKMDRKSFFKYAASAGFMIFGGGMIIKSISGLDQSANKTQSAGYGGNSYGGQTTHVKS